MELKITSSKPVSSNELNPEYPPQAPVRELKQLRMPCGMSSLSILSLTAPVHNYGPCKKIEIVDFLLLTACKNSYIIR
jgi:hypothetical protein